MAMEARKRALVLSSYVGDDEDGNEVFTKQRFSKLRNNATESQYIGLKNALEPVLRYPIVEMFEEQLNIIQE